MSQALSFLAWKSAHTQAIEAWLDMALPNNSPQIAQSEPELWQAMRYALLGGGKRFRALLVYAGGALTHADKHYLHPLAGAVEALHAYSLVHDDLPCMDDDDMRRGKPTCHKVFGEAMALLAGDALHALAFEWILSENMGNTPTHRLIQLNHFTRAIGYTGMVGGQAIDIRATGKTLSLVDLENMHRKKTGALIAVSLLLGFYASENATVIPPPILIQYAEDLGLLFQVVDDYLDATEESATLGKTAGKDAEDGKATFVTLLGINATCEKIDALLQKIETAIHQSDFSVDAKTIFLGLAYWVAKRNA